MATTTHRPAPLPNSDARARHTQPNIDGHTRKPAPTPVPVGAAKMQNWYIDPTDDRRKRMPYDVPVDGDNQRTAHLRYQCPRMRNVNGGGKERCGEFEWLLPGDPAVHCRAHGEQLVPPKQPNRLGAVLRETRRMYGDTAKTLALPAAAFTTEALAGLADVAPAELGIAALPAAGLTYYMTKRTLTRRAVARNRIERGQRTGRRVVHIKRRATRAALAAGEGGLWAAALAATDINTWAGRIIAAAAIIRWAVGVKPWWDRCEQRRMFADLPQVDTTAVVETAPPVEAPDPVRTRAVTTWAMLIGCQGGPLAGTELVDYEQLPACEVGASIRTRLPNWKAKVVAKVDGSINMREQRPNLLGRIAAAYKCTYADVSFSADPSDLSTGWLRVQPDNPLAETKLWPGTVANDWKNGRSRIGRYDDGEDIWYQWWTKTGAAHDLISGCTGSGKSELVAQLLLASLHSNGLVLDWVGDPQGGQSYGSLKKSVDWFARDKSEITLMLLAALKEMYRRNDVLSANDIKTWRPTKSMPLLVITLDEVQSFIDDPTILEMVEKLVGMGRKCGIKMRLITQIPAAYNLGGSTYIKEQLKAGQTIIFRAMTDVAGRSAVDGDCPIDPTELPDVWGKHTCAAGETTAGLMYMQGINGRDVYGRADYTGDDMSVWLVDADGQSTLTPGVFGREAQQESGPLWGDRKQRAELLLAAGRSDADLLSGGKAIELLEAAAVTQATPAHLRAPQQPAPPMTGSGRVSREVVFDAAVQAANEAGQVTKDELIAQLARMGEQMKDSTRDKALTDLMADRRLRRIKNGFYEVPGKGSPSLFDQASGAAQ
ncbi:hypothetical protein GCM10011608_10200 [Micromonospora sonchi]|uniref:FtsK domain-containing protein n=1 Tax=Micromonospora sonchi TaxID=1763543 RepID=A0A917TL96_9ACTN|nr:hypothetical protein [Micromonospora sonchi]GGM27407.1 hypothetical protein GCM10011608_10200 [Micromonospora sonchi]